MTERATWHRPMAARDTAEAHRAATPLELFFDLCFVVAVAQVSAQMHHALSAGQVARAVLSYLVLFFAVWWAWMNFTWFASAYDVDDVPYRAATLVTITGALVLAAGVPRAFERHDFAISATGYTIMRLGLIAQWLRAARSDPAGRGTARRYAAGLAVSQTLWDGWVVLPHAWQMPLLPVVGVIDLSVPVWAERAGATAWHPHHIAERYGCFTMIVLGESVLSAATATQSAIDTHGAGGGLYAVAGGGLLTVFAMWWLYFAKPAERFITATSRATFQWGYGHYAIFGSAAAVGAGLAVNVDAATGHTELSRAAASATLTVPVAVFLLALWLLHLRPHGAGRRHDAIFPVATLLVLAATFAGTGAVPAVGLLTSALVLLGLATSSQAPT